MGYSCIICDECLEVPAPEYETEIKNEPPAEAAGSEEAAAAAAAAPPPARRARKPAYQKKGGKNIRDGVPTDVVATPCGHLFHQICIARWFKDKNSMNCPACRKLCQQSKLIRLFPAVVPYHPALNDTLDFIPPPTKVEVQSAQAGSSQGAPAGAAFPTVQNMFQTFTRGLRNANEDSSDDDDDDDGVQFVGGSTNGTPIMPTLQPLQRQPQEKCTRPECEDTAFLHQTLMLDFEDIQTKYANALEEKTMQQATDQSYDEMIKTQAALIETLQGERDEFEKKLKERICINQQCIQLGLKTSNQIETLNRELDEPNNTLPRTRQGGQKRASGSKTNEVSPAKRLRSAGKDDNPPGGSGTTQA